MKRLGTILGFAFELWMRWRSAQQAAALERVLFDLEGGQAANHAAVTRLSATVFELTERVVRQHGQGARTQAYADAFNIAATIAGRQGQDLLEALYRELAKEYQGVAVRDLAELEVR